MITNARLVTFACLLFAASATAHAQGRGGTVHKGTKQEAHKAAETWAQCVYNQAGYVAQVKWFEAGTMKSVRSGDTYKISATKPAFKTENLSLGQKSCVGGKGTKHSAVLSVKGGEYARAVAIAATDIAAIGGTVGCFVGAAALTVVTAGAGAVAAVGCELLADAAIAIVAEPSIIPNAKELFAVVQPPATSGLKPMMIVMYGTVFSPQTKTGKP